MAETDLVFILLQIPSGDFGTYVAPATGAAMRFAAVARPRSTAEARAHR
jgi:hypothetical protein